MVMNRKNIYIAVFFLMTVVGFSGCKDDAVAELTTLDTDRAFSPTGLTATIVDKTGIRLSWKAVNNAKTYDIEVFETADFSGTPAKSVKDITFAQTPYTVRELKGNTQYYVRVKAIGDGVEDSKWIAGSAKTEPEQIFSDLAAGKLTSTTVTLNWPAASNVTTITCSCSFCHR
ncbi:MAG: hypothetical protein EOO42_11585 [Flavobacteriales bacterium]|nr:MAG: hypothetical protein EOO42_11585 [Flavobacteriales bacterium]